MKQCFIPREGFTLLEGDYSQLEFRLSAAFAKQTNLLEIFNDPSRDVFTESSKLLGMKRQDGKTLTYLLGYGGGPDKIKNVFGVSLDEGRAIRDNFFATYPNLLKAARYANNIALAKRRVPIWSGRYRNFLNVKEEAHKAYNSLVQGGAADIVERTMVRCRQEGLNTEDCRMLLQVHDSLVFEVRTELVPYYKIIIKECMQRVEPNWGVLFKVDIKEWGM
jgi:DNA polymerase-1